MSNQIGSGASRLGWLRLLLAASMLTMAGSALAQAAPGAPAAVRSAGRGDVAGRKAVHDFVLTEDFLHRVEAVSHDADRMKVRPSIDASHVHTLEQMVAKLEATPEARKLLDRHGLTAREYLVGTFALAGAAMTVAMSEDPRMARYIEKSRVSSVNLAFYRQHRAEIDRLLHLSRPAGASSAP